MDHRDYVRYDALGLAELIARREVSPAEVLAAARRRLDAVDPTLNCVVHRMDEIADQRAGAAVSGPFAHAPFLIKDLFQNYAGVPTTYGNAALKRIAFKPPVHAEVVRRFIAAGVNIFGKTNTPEFGAKGITEPEANGPTRNPWHPGHTPGGSSGGSAAAVAAGVVPMAGANDGGGSIRIPAACCGLFGLKPGRARVAGGPDCTDMMHGAAVDHVISRSVRDSAAMLDATAGYEPGAIVRIAPPDEPYRQAIERDPKPLRIGVMKDSPLGQPLHPEADAALAHTIAQLTDLGHAVEAAAPDLDGARLCQDFLSMWFVQMARIVDEVRASTGARAHEFELDTRAMAHLGRSLSAIEYSTIHGRWLGYRQALAAFHADYDLLLLPTLAGPPVAIGELATPGWQQAVLRPLLRLPSARVLLASGIVDRMAHENLRHVPFTQLANLTGAPAMSVPLYIGASGLPLGSQFVAPPGGETLLFRLAAQLERAAPWFDRLPRVTGVDV
ncbi:amidase [Salinisphaera sp.]|uniref:amidase n=1 Tax=Salinisphaera sp. TaxID=1914330 RepID=UPI002D76736E|nr:amidase [Salinisphaera sp.]HET7315669.1 amidase [Salinisphaera sp.]